MATRWSRYTRRKTIEALRAEAEGSRLERRLSWWHLVALGVGAMIGAGIFTIVGRAVATTGPAVSLSYGLAGLACIFAALCYAELASSIPAAGSAYSYTYATLGELAAWIIAWNLVAEYMVGNIGVAIAWSNNLEVALSTIGIEIPTRLTAATGTALTTAAGEPVTALFDLPAFLIVLAVTCVLAVGIRASNATNLVLTSFKLGALFLFIALGSMRADPANWAPFAPGGAAGVFTGAAIVFFAFIGFDTVSAAAEEAKRPRRDLPIGIIGSLVLTALIYVVVSLVLAGMVPAGQVDQDAALARAFTSAGYGRPHVLLIAAGAVAATTSVLLVFQLGIARILMHASRDGLIPPGLARIHPRFRTPARLTLLGGTLTALGAATVPFGDAIDFTNLSTLFVFVVVSVAVLVLRRQAPRLERPFRVPAAPLVVGLAVLTLGALMAFIGPLIWLYFGVWTGLGLVVYALWGSTRSRLGAGGAPPPEMVLEIDEPR